MICTNVFKQYRRGSYSVPDDLKWFGELDGSTQIHSFNSKSSRKKIISLEKDEIHKVLSNEEIFSTLLIEYLRQKCIPIELTKKILTTDLFLKSQNK